MAEVGAVSGVGRALELIGREDPRLCAFIEVWFERALADAERARGSRWQGCRSRSRGVPASVRTRPGG